MEDREPMTAKTTILVVNGDDFGLSEAINRGMLAAHETGILRSTSIMPNGPAFEDAVRIALEHPSLDVGIHLTLTGEPSVAPAGELRSLVNDEGFLPESSRMFTRGLLSRRFSIGDVQTEMRAQIEHVLEAGIEPSHLDSHQHVHMLPAVFAVALDLAREYGIPTIRVSVERAVLSSGGFFARLIQTALLPRIDRVRLDQVRNAGLHTADWFWGLGMTRQMDEAELMGTLRSLRPGVNEVMCHPGISDPFTAGRYPGYAWEDELAALRSDAVRRYIDEKGIRLASFRDARDESSSR